MGGSKSFPPFALAPFFFFGSCGGAFWEGCGGGGFGFSTSGGLFSGGNC